MIGKVPASELIDRVLGRTGRADPAVRTGPAYGEDAAAIALDGHTLVVSSDPISLAVGRVGTLGVHVACNDVAASGGRPRWLTVVILLPSAAPDRLDTITRQLDETAADVGVAIVGGHSEYAAELARPTLSLTCIGVADQFVPTAGARPGDSIVLTKGAGIEGTAILATDFREALGSVEAAVLERAETFYGDISVVEEARLLADHARAMHDPTEGGVVAGLVELALASGVAVSVARDDVPVRTATRQLCSRLDVDPLRIFGSGSLLAAVPDDRLESALTALTEAGIEVTVIGSVTEAEPAGLHLDGEVITDAGRDDLYRLWEP